MVRNRQYNENRVTGKNCGFESSGPNLDHPLQHGYPFEIYSQADNRVLWWPTFVSDHLTDLSPRVVRDGRGRA
jgi:hypothetical protein